MHWHAGGQAVGKACASWWVTSVGQDEDGVCGDAHLYSQLLERFDEVFPQLRAPPWAREQAVSRAGVGEGLHAVSQPPLTRRAQAAAGRLSTSLLVLPNLSSVILDQP